MRITSGKLKGQRLKNTERLADVRPTSERVREAIFSALQARLSLDESRVLDIFAGTGAFGFEAISRGAKFCDFVEKSRKVVGVLKDNVEQFGLSSQVSIHTESAENFLTKNRGEVGKYDLVFADPPYGLFSEIQLGEMILVSDLLKPDGFFVFEGRKQKKVEIEPLYGFTCISRKTYGDTEVSFFAPSS